MDNNGERFVEETYVTFGDNALADPDPDFRSKSLRALTDAGFKPVAGGLDDTDTVVTAYSAPDGVRLVDVLSDATRTELSGQGVYIHEYPSEEAE